MKTLVHSLVSAIVLAASPVHAQERIGQFQISKPDKAALLNGPITGETGRDFDAVLTAVPDLKALALNSPGGQVVGALAIADKVHALGVTTVVLQDASCASACSMIFLAGRDRFAAGALGVHQMSAEQPSDMGVVQYVISDILDAFSKYGVDARVTRFMLTTPPGDMHFFNDAEKMEYRLNRRQEAAPDASGLVPTEVAARRDGAQFADHPAGEAYRGRAAKPRYEGNAEWARNYRTRVREGLAEGPNFAGRWSLIEIGCGSSCRFVVLIDVKTGEIAQFPLGGEENYQMELTYTVESNLVKSIWMDTSVGDYDTCVQQDFVLQDSVLTKIWENRYTIKRFDFCTAYQ